MGKLKLGNNNPICLICSGRTALFDIVSSQFLIDNYKKRFEIAIDQTDFINQNIVNFKCKKCGFIFFNEKEGESKFYDACKNSGKYFEYWRWEFSIVLEKLKNRNPKNIHLDVGSGTGIFSSSISGLVAESWLVDYVPPEIVNPNLYFVYANGTEYESEVDKSKIEWVEGNMFRYHIPRRLISESDKNFSEITLSENDTILQMPSTQHESIKNHGQGRYSHWGDFLYFSSSDNSDPRDNSHDYKIKTNYLKDTYFDSISIFHTLEHVENPIEFLLDIKKHIKKNGTIYISVPNSYSNYREKIKSEEVDDFDLLNYPPHHLTWWRPEDLINLARVCGLVPKGIYLEILGNSIKSSMINSKRHKSESVLLIEKFNNLYLNDVLYAKSFDCELKDFAEVNNQGFTMLIELQA
jgi:SAM-dependent methyltransferase